MASVTNRKAQPALRGQSVIVTLDSTDAAVLDSLEIGTTCTVGGTSNTGKIVFVDTKGCSFKITPTEPDQYFSGSSNGLFPNGATVTY